MPTIFVNPSLFERGNHSSFFQIAISTFFIFALGISVGVVAAFAQTNEIEITVKDVNSAPIAGANVVLRNAKTGLEQSVMTDSNGNFV